MSSKVILSLLSFFFAPFLLLLVFVIILASFGKSFGVRNLYVNLLLKVFDWGKQKIDKHERRRSLSGEESEELHNTLIDKDITQTNHGTEEETESHLIKREISLSSKGLELSRKFSIVDMERHFQLSDAMYFARSGIEAIIEDEVTQRFSAAELSSWNLLTRTNKHYEFVSYRLTFLWLAGWVVRYIILLPFRMFLACFAVGSMLLGTALVGQLPNSRFKNWMYTRVSKTCYRILMRGFSGIVTFHNKENKAKGGGICVANHTSPVDIIILGTDNTYAMVGQKQGGFIGVLQNAMNRASSNIWFMRSEAKDRSAVAKRLRDHVEDKEKLPILIFPEGTCINNTSIMMFKKGSFEVGGTIYPAAIKYDPRFADAFWNSSTQGFMSHLFMILTSWALVCDVWYLPPQTIEPGEDAVQFANRIKSEIAAQGGLVDLEWDGMLKRSKPKPAMKEKQQEEYSKRLKGE